MLHWFRKRKRENTNDMNCSVSYGSCLRKPDNSDLNELLKQAGDELRQATVTYTHNLLGPGNFAYQLFVEGKQDIVIVMPIAPELLRLGDNIPMQQLKTRYVIERVQVFRNTAHGQTVANLHCKKEPLL